jgi:hypothetical protein
MAKTTKKAEDQVERFELTLRVPGLEALAVKMAEHELERDEARSARDSGELGLELKRLELERERLALQRLELEQRVREWQLEKAEREARLAARGKDLGL